MEAIAKKPNRLTVAIAAFVFPLLIFSLFFHNLATSSAQSPLWENLGIYGGTVYDATIDPATGRAYLVTQLIPGIYWSDDNGGYWQWDQDSKVGGAGSIEIGPDRALYATVSTGFLRSTDGGQTWTTLVDASQALYASTIQGSDVDPNNFDHLLIATGGSADNDGAVYSTLDGGKVWVTATLSISATADIKDVAIDPIRPGVTYATSNDFRYSNTPSYIYRSVDGGLSFTPVFTAPLGVQFQEIGVNAVGTVYAGSSIGVFRSEDGLHWDFTAVGGKMVAFGITDPSIIYVDFAISHNNGLTWEPSQVNTFVAESTADPNLLFTAGPLGIQRSFDNGISWENCVTGIDAIEIQAVAADPFDNQIMYAATSHGAARSMDGGSTWEVPLGDLELYIHDLSIDPSQPGVLYLAASDGKLYKSVDYGETFTITQAVLKSGFTIWDILVDPRQSNKFYAATLMPTETGMMYGGLVRSDDFANTWITTTLKGDPVNSIQAGLLTTDTVIYAGLGDYWLGGEGGVYRSLDDGNSWLALGLKNKVVSELAVHPLDGRTLYVGLGGVFANTYGHYLYWTPDMGKSWEPLSLDTDTGIETIRVDEDDPQTIYASTLDQVYISRDAGQTWSLIHESQRGEKFQAAFTPQRAPAPVKFLDPVISENGIQLKWRMPPDLQLAGVNLRLLTTTFPTAHTLGISLTDQVAIPGSSMGYTYMEVFPGTTYYFTAFSYDKTGRFSPPAYISVKFPTIESNTLHFTDESIKSEVSAPSVSLTARIFFLATSKGLFRYTEPPPADILFLPLIRKQ